MWFVNFLKDFIGAPAILLGIFILLGCILQKKNFSQTITSTLKTIVGFIVMQAGATILTGTLTSFSSVFQDLFGLKGAIPLNEATAAMLAEQASDIVQVGSIIMIVAVVLNMFYAQFTRMKYIYLSGHCLFYMSVMLAGTAQMTGLVDINTVEGFTMAVITGGLLMSLYMILQPTLTQRWMVQITGTKEIALGHTGGFGYMMSGFIGEGIGKLFKGKIRSTEDIKMPKGLAFFRNTTVSIAVIMFVIYLAIFIPEGIRYEQGLISESSDAGKAVIELFGKSNWLVTSIIQAFTFAAAIEIILLGVRTFVGELIPAFKGISNKFIKNSKPAVDCPITFPYAPNAVIIGFISAFVGGIAAMGISIAISYETPVGVYIILPSIMNIFFQGATSGIFGNVKGGILGAIIGPFLQSIIFHLVPIIFMAAGWVPTVANPELLNSVGWGDTDYLLGGIFALFAFIPGKAAVYVLLGVLLTIVIGLMTDGFFFNKKQKQIKKEEELLKVEIESKKKQLIINNKKTKTEKVSQTEKPKE